MRRVSKVLMCLCVLGVVVAGNAVAATVFDVNFSSDTPGNLVIEANAIPGGVSTHPSIAGSTFYLKCFNTYTDPCTSVVFGTGNVAVLEQSLIGKGVDPPDYNWAHSVYTMAPADVATSDLVIAEWDMMIDSTVVPDLEGGDEIDCHMIASDGNEIGTLYFDIYNDSIYLVNGEGSGGIQIGTVPRGKKLHIKWTLDITHRWQVVTVTNVTDGNTVDGGQPMAPASVAPDLSEFRISTDTTGYAIDNVSITKAPVPMTSLVFDVNFSSDTPGNPVIEADAIPWEVSTHPSIAGSALQLKCFNTYTDPGTSVVFGTGNVAVLEQSLIGKGVDPPDYKWVHSVYTLAPPDVATSDLVIAEWDMMIDSVVVPDFDAWEEIDCHMNASDGNEIGTLYFDLYYDSIFLVNGENRDGIYLDIVPRGKKLHIKWVLDVGARWQVVTVTNVTDGYTVDGGQPMANASLVPDLAEFRISTDSVGYAIDNVSVKKAPAPVPSLVPQFNVAFTDDTNGQKPKIMAAVAGGITTKPTQVNAYYPSTVKVKTNFTDPCTGKTIGDGKVCVMQEKPGAGEYNGMWFDGASSDVAIKGQTGTMVIRFELMKSWTADPNGSMGILMASLPLPGQEVYYYVSETRFGLENNSPVMTSSSGTHGEPNIDTVLVPAGSFTSGVPFEFAFAVDIAAWTYTAYVDGVAVATALPLHTDSNTIQGVKIKNYSDGKGDVALDNFAIMSAPMRCGDVRYFPDAAVVGDLDGDCKVNMADIGIFAAEWLCSSGCGASDITGNGKVNFADFARLATNWLYQETF